MSERPSEAAGVPRARMMLQRAHWAATAFAGYDLERTRRIVDAVADAAYQNAKRYAEWAVSETGMGVAEHKLLKNEACSRGLVEWWGGEDYVSARVLADQRIVEIPRPAGVVLALTPSTNPVATLYFKVLLSLMTRNAVVVSPHPLAREKLFPLLGLVRVPDARRGIDAARAMLRIGGGGHSAVIHSHDPRTVMAYGSAVQVLRVAVNVGGSTGSAGIDTNLAPTMTIGTGFFGRSSLGENLEPRHLINLTRLAYTHDPAERFGDFTDLQPWNAALDTEPVAAPEMPRDVELAREEIRRMVLEELRELVKR